MSRIIKQTLIALILIQTITSVIGQAPNTSSEDRPKILYFKKRMAPPNRIISMKIKKLKSY